ncbi:hypothetical protein [Pseudomonas protegens]|uniref:hypothetical protein n=1 Tax=Pseudomonas protegens TaxID=380021 RepID=UPI003906A43B
MMRYKIFPRLLALICSALFSLLAFSNEQQCLPNMPKTTLDVFGCFQEGDITILKLAARDQPTYETNLENLPTFIVIGKTLDEVMRALGKEVRQPYNNLIKLPYPSAIIHIAEASKAARLKLVKEGWRLLDMKDFTYGKTDGTEGANVICSTLISNSSDVFIAVSQCSSFYEEDISKLRDILGSVGN